VGLVTLIGLISKHGSDRRVRQQLQKEACRSATRSRKRGIAPPILMTTGGWCWLVPLLTASARRREPFQYGW